ncbi:galactitol-1-phosphate 5-dehydrogenase [Pseudobutyrivibrio sp. LB2011]|uniref:galactitol-1-phosphate 5-dehydrogenase n=1 Tax=Pseudobutyrivibrio sp. LB2011 TaxID=1408312 RepID=UPI0005D25248|nr:galactitol-1-phosphate 5-dehydrogenase [Pseudobutyrivibrio sp. LB2011]
MKALVLEDVGKIKIDEIAKPSPKQGEVLVHVKACGICGSDIPRAYKDGAHNMPLVIGHEFAGEVCEVGEGVDSSWAGKAVGIFPLIPCKKCPCCVEKKYEMCKNYSYLGSRVDGGFAEYVAVPEWNLMELGSGVAMEQAAMMEPMAVAVHAIRQGLRACGKDLQDLGQLRKAKVAVIGLGTIGLLVTMFLKDMGFENVYTIGKKEIQRQKAFEFGVDEAHYVKEISDVDLFFECVGSTESLITGINAAAPGGVVCTVGNPSSDMNIDRHAYWQILRNQLTLVGTWNSSFTHDTTDDWHYVLGRLQQGAVKPEKLITHKFGLEGILEGFEIMRDKKEEYVKVMGEIGK